MTPAYRIYLSAPADSNLSQAQLDVKKSIIRVIEQEGFEPQEFFRSGIPKTMAWSFENVETVMSRCQGVAILAFARWLAASAKDEDSRQSIYLPSEYNHFEGALAFARRLPRLVITDERVRTAGITLLSEGPVIFWPEGVGAVGTSEARFREQLDSWAHQIRSRPDVFLGYCGEARSTASELTLFIEREVGLRVQNYAMDFSAGPTIYEQIEAAARSCACGIFLFTKDDPLEGTDGAAPRDNVVFEAGYFFRANGRERVAVIREEGAKMPADLGGNVYIDLKDRGDIAPIHSQLRRFLERAR
jgi:Predicted nucleotide-binding protein containing TIR-like domain